MVEGTARPEFVGGTQARDKARRSAAERVYGAVQVVVQVAVRGWIILAVLAVNGVLGSPLILGAWSPDPLKEGSAVLTDCSSVDPGWLLAVPAARCSYDITWSDGERGRGVAESVYLDDADVGQTKRVLLIPGSGLRSSAHPRLDLPAPYAPVGNTVALGGVLFALLAPVWIPWRAWPERREVIRRRRFRTPPWLTITLGYGLAVGGSFGFVAEPPTAGLAGWGPLAWPPLLAVVAGLSLMLWGFGASVSRRQRGYPVPGRPPFFVRWLRFGWGAGLLAVGLIAVSGILGGGLGQWHSAVVVTRLTVPVVLVVLGLSALVVWSHQVRLSRSAADAWQSSPYLEAAADEAVRERRDAGPEPAPPLH